MNKRKIIVLILVIIITSGVMISTFYHDTEKFYIMEK